MESMQQILHSYMMPNLPYVLLVMMVVMIVSLIVFIVINIKLSRLNQKYQKMMNGVEGRNLEENLHDHMIAMREAVDNIQTLTTHCKELDEKSKKAI